MTKSYSILGVTLAVMVLLGTLVAGMTADEIYDRMEAEADAMALGGMVSTLRFDNVYGDGTTQSYLFGSLASPGYSMIYFVEPADVHGTIMLTHEAQDDGEDARIWLFLPVLGVAKELVSEEERGGSFAGSALSYEDLGDDDRRKDYDAVLLGDEQILVGDLARTAHRIEATARPDADVDTIRTVLWVDAEFFTMLRMEGYNDLGNLDATMEVLTLVEFEGKLTPGEILATNESDGSATTITFLERQRPQDELSATLFAPENLKSFDPTPWGF